MDALYWGEKKKKKNNLFVNPISLRILYLWG